MLTSGAVHTASNSLAAVAPVMPDSVWLGQHWPQHDGGSVLTELERRRACTMLRQRRLLQQPKQGYS